MTLPKLTDPAQELYMFVQDTRGLSAPQRTLSQFLPVVFKQESYTDTFWAIARAVRSRFTALELIVSAPTSPVSEHVREHHLTSVKRLSAFLDLQGSGHTQWDGLRVQLFPEADVSLLFSLSGILRPAFPLRQLDEDERKKLCAAISSLIAGIPDAGLPEWAIAPLRQSLNDVLLALEFFPFFGHEETARRTFNAATTAKAATDTRRKGSPSRRDFLSRTLFTLGAVAYGVGQVDDTTTHLVHIADNIKALAGYGRAVVEWFEKHEPAALPGKAPLLALPPPEGASGSASLALTVQT